MHLEEQVSTLGAIMADNHQYFMMLINRMNLVLMRQVKTITTDYEYGRK